MQKITAKYIMWKVVISFLTQLMAVAVGVPFLMVAKANELDGRLVSLFLSGGTFLIFLYLQYQLMRRSDLSAISKKNYLIGECTAFGILCLLGQVLLLAFSGGLLPSAVSYHTAVFSCTYFCTYALNVLFLGLPLQILLFFLFLLALYALKKKKDPSLKGPKKIALQKDLPSVLAEDARDVSDGEEDGVNTEDEKKEEA